MTEKDIATLRDKVKKVEARNAVLEKRMQIVDLTDVEDADLKNMKQYFLEKDEEIEKDRAEVNSRLEKAEKLESDNEKRERSGLVTSLAERYKLKAEDFQDAEDPEKKALQLVVERQASGEKKDEEVSPEEVFEHNQAGGKLKKMPEDMINAKGEVDEEALAAFEKEHAIPSK